MKDEIVIPYNNLVGTVTQAEIWAAQLAKAWKCSGPNLIEMRRCMEKDMRKEAQYLKREIRRRDLDAGT